MPLLDFLSKKKEVPAKKVIKIKKPIKPIKKAIKVIKVVKKVKAVVKKNIIEKKPVKQAEKEVKKPAEKIVEIPKVLDEKAFEMIKDSKIPITPYCFCKTEKDLPEALKKTGFPCVMKVSGKLINHKSDIGGIIKNINSEEEAKKALANLIKIKNCEKVIVQKQIDGIELIIGSKSDPNFGQVVSIGIGGIYVEVLKDVVFRICPISVSDAEAMTRELKGYGILAGMRGQKPIKLEMLYDIIVKVGKLAASNEIKEMDLNPVMCNSEGCWAVDVRIFK